MPEEYVPNGYASDTSLGIVSKRGLFYKPIVVILLINNQTLFLQAIAIAQRFLGVELRVVTETSVKVR